MGLWRSVGVAVALLAPGLTACPSNQTSAPPSSSSAVDVPRAAPPDEPTGPRIAVIGSSTPAGYGLADPATSWVNRYAAHLAASHPGASVANFAVPGYTTFHVLPTGMTNPPSAPAVDEGHNVTAALAARPHAVIVNLPSNDAAYGFAVDDTMRNLHIVADEAERGGASVWICTSQPRALDAIGIARLRETRARTLADFGDRAIDFWTPLAAPSGTLLPRYDQGDGIHANAEGHQLLFEIVKRLDLPAALAARRPSLGGG